MFQAPPRWLSRTAWTVLCVQLVTLFAPLLVPVRAWAQGASDVQLGQEYYEQSRFDEAILLLKDLVARGTLKGAELVRAQEYLARSYVKKGDLDKGRETFKALLNTDATWRPDAIRVPPDEMTIFDQALSEYQSESATPPTPPQATPPAPTPTQPSPARIMPTEPKKKSSKLWWYVGGGAVVVALVAVLAGGGGGGSSEPAPTPWPYNSFPPHP